MVSKEVKDLRKLKDLAFGGALATESTSLISIAGAPGAAARITPKISSFVGIGIAGKASDVSFGLATGKRKRRKKKKGR